MPEYLSPGVYVEEIDTGAKPIEGVSTSTAGMVGVTERGPVNVPILLTNTGDYARWFGGLLDLQEFGRNAFLPHAVDGFFTNGGRRLYVSRVLAPGSSNATLELFDRGDSAAFTTAPPASVLLQAAAIGVGNATPLLVLDAKDFTANEFLRIGDGSNAEWHQVSGAPAAATGAMLDYPLTQSYRSTDTLNTYTQVVDGAFSGDLQSAATQGDTVLMVTSANDLTTINIAERSIELMHTGPREICRITGVQRLTPVSVSPGMFRINLARPLNLSHPADTTFRVLETKPPPSPPPPPTVGSDLHPGDQFLPNSTAAAGTILEFVPNSGPVEMRRVSSPGRVGLSGAAGRGFPRGSEVELLNLNNGANTTQLIADAPAGSVTLRVNERKNLAVGAVLQIGAPPLREFATVAALPGSDGGTPAGSGPVTLASGLRWGRASGLVVQIQATPAEADARAGLLLRDVTADETELLVTETQGYNAGNAVRVTTPDGTPFIVSIDPAQVATTAPHLVTLQDNLTRNQPAGATLVGRASLLQVQAIDTGSWGNRLLIAIEDETSGLVSGAAVTGTIAADRIRLSSLSGIEPGSVLELRATDGSRIGGLIKVTAIHRNDGSATLDTGLDADQLAAVTAPGARVPVHSREFRLTVMLRRRDDPAVPSRGDQIADTELFRNLSMDPRHSRYVETVIGRIDGPPRLEDRRPEGASNYIRVADVATPAVPMTTDPRWIIRLGPEPLTDLLPSGITRAARIALAGGDDGLGTISDPVFTGVDDREPANRTGIFSLKNIDDISIVAAPGQVSPVIQQALINHCEEMRYRFAVLDGPAPPADAIADVQALRQNYDTKYAALYYPWLTIPDPLPDNLSSIAQVPIPPAGHIVGTYARVDIDRGVHKAPANEVISGITGLRRYLNKGENDILNPYPSNINVIRDFRPDFRAIRIWGARVITSDPDYKYVPVRRLLIFIEKSIDRGLQWVVFEPNAEPLWARVRFAIESFLNTVWRNGALEGTKPEQAYFVICDRTTMTQDDIDNGRLICVVGVAPVKPAEFVIVRIGLKTAVAES